MARKRSEPEGWAPSNTHPANTKIVASGIDTLHLGFRGELRPEVAADLETRRERALAVEQASEGRFDEASSELEYELGSTKLLFSGHARRGYRYRLHNADVTLRIARCAPGATPTVIAQLRAFFLWRVGWKQAIDQTRALVDKLGLSSSLSGSRERRFEDDA